MSGGRAQRGTGVPAGTFADGDASGDARQRRRRRAVLATLLLGVVVMVAFDHWFTLLAGIVLMLGAVVAGTLLVADPGGFLDHDRPAESDDGRPAEADVPDAAGPSGA